MESSVKLVRTVRVVLLASIVFCAGIAAWVRPYNPPKTWTYFYVITGVAVWSLEGIFFFRRRKLGPSEAILSATPEDVVALRGWRTGYIAIYALCHNLALWGLLLRFLRFSLPQVLPFFVAGFLLLLYFAPRRPSNAIG